MNTYYFDDDNDRFDHWRQKSFQNDEEALIWAEKLKKFFTENLLGTYCILYCDTKEGTEYRSRTVKEWNT